MVINNVIVGIFIIYMFVMPLTISFENKISSENITILMIFDVIFLIDRSLDLFVGYYREDG